jgi:hypothetical protein
VVAGSTLILPAGTTAVNVYAEANDASATVAIFGGSNLIE